METSILEDNEIVEQLKGMCIGFTKNLAMMVI